MVPRKRRLEEITELRQPGFSAGQQQGFDEGIALFNAGSFWHAHEAWEHVWMELDDDAEIVLRGLIQLAAALHCRSASRPAGMQGNLRKALPKLLLARPVFWGIDIEDLLRRIELLNGDPSGDVRIISAA